MAMKWVQRHFARFGGDASRVTVMGYSAGAISISLHLVSPMSRGLFHKVIVMEGASTDQCEIPTQQLEVDRKQAKPFKCPDASVAALVQCFINVV